LKIILSKENGPEKLELRPLPVGAAGHSGANAEAAGTKPTASTVSPAARGFAAAHRDHGRVDRCFLRAVWAGRAGNESRRMSIGIGRQRFVAANAVGSNPAGVEPTQTFIGATINADEARNFLAVELPCCSASLPTCNANVLLCMSLCIARASHFHRGNFILKLWIDRRSIVLQIPAMTPDLF
jgi:hypothetical protein